MRGIAKVCCAGFLALVFCAAIQSTALAQPEFLPLGVSFTAKSGATTFVQGSTPVLSCSKDTGKGLTGHVKASFLWTLEGCSSSSLGLCPSTINLEQVGELGDVAEAEAASKVGQLFNTEALFKCGTNEVEISGNVAGEVTPVLAPVSADEVRFEVNASLEQKIKSITVGSGLQTPQILISVNSSTPKPLTLLSVETNSFPMSIEVT